MHLFRVFPELEFLEFLSVGTKKNRNKSEKKNIQIKKTYLANDTQRCKEAGSFFTVYRA